MAYTKYHSPWADANAATGGGDETTPLVAAALDHIEQGIFDAAATADAAIPKAISGVATDKVPVYNGSAWVAQKLVNAQIDAAAAIAYSKLNLTGSIVNADLAPTWSDYTPVLTATTTNPTMGTGAIAHGRYMQLGKLVLGTALIQFGTSGMSGGSGTYRISVPVAGVSTDSLVEAHGMILDAGTRFYFTEARLVTSTTLEMTEPAGNAVTPTNPFTFTINDRFLLQFLYEAA